MNTRLLGIAALCGALLIPSIALAQGKRKERRQDKREIRQDKAQIVDDRLDHARLVALLADFDRHVQNRNRRGLDNIDARLKKMLREEMRESRKELRQDRREVARSKKEVRRSDSRRGARDDRRDLRDDKRDAAQEAKALQRRRAIRDELTRLYGKHRPRQLKRKRVLIQDLIKLARQENRQNRRELREDRRELREDRRDNRTDKRRKKRRSKR